MNQPSIEKISCPSCGQRYTVELSEEKLEVTCSACHAVFIVTKTEDHMSSTHSPAISSSTAKTQPIGPQSLPSQRPSSTLNQKAKMKILDRFMALLFRFGKSFASLLAVLCLLSVFASLAVFAWTLRTSMKVPSYSDIAPTGNNGQSSESNNTQELDERRALEKKFGDQVADLVKKHQFDQTDYDPLMNMVASVDEKRRQKFLNGLEDALKQRAKAAEMSPKEALTVRDTAISYRMAFGRAESEYESKKIAAKSTRLFALGATFVSCFMLFLMLIVPALLRIEENTRRA
jgi:hypothetical protein